MLADIRSAFRQISRHRGLSLLAIATLALGIGANTAIFSVIHSALLEPLPYPEPDQLVGVFEELPSGGHNAVSGGAFKDWYAHSSSFSHLAITELTRHNLTGSGTPELVTGMRVTAEYLDVLGVDLILGRGLVKGEDSAGGDSQVVILTDAFWRTQFGARSDVLGQVISLDQMPHTVVGVLPPQALLINNAMFLAPLVVDEDPEAWARSGHWKSVVGRLQPEVTAEIAQTELRSIKQRLADEYPQFKDEWSVAVVPLQEVAAGDTQSTLTLLLGTVALVLLIACANVSNLLLVRGSARFREMAIRSSLGAHTWRIVRQMLIESLVLALIGCGFGLLLAEFGVDFLGQMFADQLPMALHPELDHNVLIFSLLVACGCGLLFGILPALRASKVGLDGDLKDIGRGSTSGARKRSQNFLVIAEFALSLVLLVGAGLLLRSFLVLLNTDPGFEPRGTLVMDLNFPQAKYPADEARFAFITELREHLEVLPGVESVAASLALPFSYSGWTEMASRADREETYDYLVQTNFISGDYFSTMGIGLLRGRLLTEADQRQDAAPVMVISRDLAADLYPDEEALGQRLRVLEQTWEIVGIVPSVRHYVMDRDPHPGVYVPQSHSPRSTSLVLRTTVPPASLTEAVRAAIHAVDPDQPIANVRTLEQSVQQSLAPRRLTLSLLGCFAIIAILLAGIGIYGVMSFSIQQRSREFSIRSALGAGRRDVMRLILEGGMKPSLIGIGIGLAMALILVRLLDSLLFGIVPYDPLVFAGAVGLLAAAAALSILLPARRAAKIDATEALRVE